MRAKKRIANVAAKNPFMTNLVVSLIAGVIANLLLSHSISKKSIHNNE